MVESLRPNVPDPWSILWVFAGALVLQIAALSFVLMKRRQARSAAARAAASAGDAPLGMRAAAVPLWPQVLAGLSILAPLITAGRTVTAARALFVSGFDASSPARAALVGEGLVVQVSAISFATTSSLLCLALWLVGLGLVVDARRPRMRAPVVALIAIAVVGLTPMAVGILQWCLPLTRAFRALPGVALSERTSFLSRALDEARTAIERHSLTSLVAMAIATVVAVVLLFVRRSPRVAAEASPAGKTGRFAVPALATGALLAAYALATATRPFRIENEMPWPPPNDGDNLQALQPITPDLVASDVVRRAPLVSVFPDFLFLDGVKVGDLRALEDKLRARRSYFDLDHPGETFSGEALMMAGGETSPERLRQALRAARAAGFPVSLFTFTKEMVMQRPILGTRKSVRATAARVTLVDSGPVDDDGQGSGSETAALEGATSLSLGAFADYDALARRIVELRKRGRSVVLDLGS
jgi:hypothetical protein